MLHFTGMTISNFGPYKGEQEIDFTKKQGVTIFWGDNGRGKTTLLNAFRYALFGIIKRRNGDLDDLREMENKEGREQGVYGFSVSLAFENDGNKYNLTRQYKPRKSVKIPMNEEDYERDTFLKKGGSILSSEEREHELNMIMPEQVSRFFLFDAELLQEYEELLENDNTTGERIKEAIEKILGVPVLTQGVVDIQSCLYEYERQKQKAAQKDDKTKQYGNQLDLIEASIKEHKKIIEEKKAERRKYFSEKADLESKMESTEKVRGWIDREDFIKTESALKKTRIEEIEKQIKEVTKEAWKGMLADTIDNISKLLSAEINTLDKKKQKEVIAESFIKEIKKACKDQKCPVCEQAISNELAIKLEKRIKESESEYAGLSKEEQEKLLSLQAQLAGIGQLRVDSKKKEVELLEGQRTQLKIEIGTYEQEAKELREKIVKYGGTAKAAEATQVARDYAKVIQKMSIIDEAIAAETTKLQEEQDNKTKILKQIDKQSAGSDLKEAKEKYELCNKIFSVFEKGMGEYREKLKKNVEKDSTEIFVQLSSDKDYVALQINENYGLSIVHKSGTLVPGRSSGFEHIVALSLIGALHKNAPMQGPIIMDSPFGRLDPTHKKNIVSALPEMAGQSMLLAYTDEIDEQVARKTLAGNLVREFKLNRVTSMHTVIE